MLLFIICLFITLGVILTLKLFNYEFFYSALSAISLILITIIYSKNDNIEDSLLLILTYLGVVLFIVNKINGNI